MATNRAVSAALHTPQLGGERCHTGTKIQTRHHLATQRKFQPPKIPKLEYEALIISEVVAPFERKMPIHDS